jgi:hypothetical protein
MKHGMKVAISFDHMIRMLRATHQEIASFGIPLIPFNDFLAQAFSTDTPNSFSSLLLAVIAEDFSENLSQDYYLLSLPFRFISRKVVQLNYNDLAVGFLGPAFQISFKPTTTFVALESFKVIFSYLTDGAIIILQSHLLSTLMNAMNDLIDALLPVKSILIRPKNPNMIQTPTQVFDIFEGAYRIFLFDPKIRNLLKNMAYIGNILAIFELMDQAYLLKNQSNSQINAYLTSYEPTIKLSREEHEKLFPLNPALLQVINNPNSDTKPQTPTDDSFYTQGEGIKLEDNLERRIEDTEMYKMFDKEFEVKQEWCSEMVKRVGYKNEEIVPPFLSSALQCMLPVISGKDGAFQESSTNLLDITSLRGWAVNWSVLEFVMCLFDSKEDEKFGEGVQLCAAAILEMTGQQSLYRAISICERIRVHSVLHFAEEDDRIAQFLDHFDFFSASFNCARQTYNSILAKYYQ